jgi:hypothetical protein
MDLIEGEFGTFAEATSELERPLDQLAAADGIPEDIQDAAESAEWEASDANHAVEKRLRKGALAMNKKS